MAAELAIKRIVVRTLEFMISKQGLYGGNSFQLYNLKCIVCEYSLGAKKNLLLIATTMAQDFATIVGSGRW